MGITANVFPVNVVNFGQLMPEVPTPEPIGYWFGQSEVTGDASGGGVIVNYLLTSGADTFPFKGRSPLGVYLSLEEIRGRVNFAAINNISKQLMLAGNLAQTFVVTGLGVLGAPNTQFVNLQAEDGNVPRTPYSNLFICSPGLTYSVSYAWSVNVNNGSYNSFAWGFIWDVKSILELGGPKRPQGFNPF